MIRVLFVDDEPKLRRAWERLFATQADFQLLGMLPHADGVVQAVFELRPEVVVLDLTMPGIDPLEAIKQLADETQSRTVVYSAHSGLEVMRSVFDAGAWGFVDKLAAPEEMFEVLRRVAAGEVVVPPQLSTRGS